MTGQFRHHPTWEIAMTAPAPEASATPPPPAPPVFQPPPPVSEPPAGATSVVIDGETFYYPPKTPLTDMTEPQRTEYWREKAQKHEKAAKVTPEQLTELRDKAAKVDQLEYDLGSETDRAVAAAKVSAAAAARAELVPDLVQARFEAAAAGRLTAEQITTILGPLDANYFLDANGKVDTAKVAAYVDEIAPVKGPDQQRRGPSAGGTGRVGTTSQGGGSVSAGRELFENRRGKRTASTT